MMRFKETSIFTEQITKLLGDDEYLELQWALILQPELGPVMPRCGGARKVRWGQVSRGKGKRGGIRVIYFWDADSEFYMLYAFGKNEQDTLTKAQEKILKELIKKELS